MIANEVERRVTAANLRKFAEAERELVASEGDSPERRALELTAIRSCMEDFRAELSEYDELRAGGVTQLRAASLRDLAVLLIKARIARGWTQRDLARLLGVAEQQVQKYEQDRYATATLTRICEIAAALGIEISEEATLRELPV